MPIMVKAVPAMNSISPASWAISTADAVATAILGAGEATLRRAALRKEEGAMAAVSTCLPLKLPRLHAAVLSCGTRLCTEADRVGLEALGAALGAVRPVAARAAMVAILID